MLNYGLESLTARLEQIGVDAILPVDVPYEEREEIDQFCRPRHLDLITIVSPATDHERMKTIVSGSRGFIYYVSCKGVTGNPSQFSCNIGDNISHLKTVTTLPIAIGFGISSPKDVQYMGRFSDGFVIGSASIKQFLNAKSTSADGLEKQLKEY